MGGKLLTLSEGFADESVRTAHALVEALEIVRRLVERARQVLLRMLGARADQLEQAHAFIGQMGDALATSIELGAAFRKTRSEARGGPVERAAGFAPLRGDPRHFGRQRGHSRGEGVAAFGQAGNVSEMLLLALGDRLVERRHA